MCLFYFPSKILSREYQYHFQIKKKNQPHFYQVRVLILYKRKSKPRLKENETELNPRLKNIRIKEFASQRLYKQDGN